MGKPPLALDYSAPAGSPGIMRPMLPLRIGIIGGSGLEQALNAQQGQAHQPDTPFGPPSSPIILTQWEGVEVAILQRHGPGHRLNPSQVPYRANIYALKTL